jgi:hypothetical protein
LTKTWVDARVSVGPTGVNEVNHKHTITGHVDVNGGSGWTNAPDGTQIDFTASDGTLSSSSCFTAGGTGSCTVDLNSNTPGVITVNASTTVLVSGKSITRTTDSTHGSSGPMTKTYVDARIHVAQDGTNEVNHAHNVTGFLEINDGTNGWVPAPNGTTISYSIASGPGSLTPTSCATAGGIGKCTVSLNSATAGITKVNASATVSVLGVSMTRTTDSTGGNGGPLTKTWVDANIQVGTTATNVVTDPHTVTGHVNINPGTGFVNAPNGTTINFTIVSGPGSLNNSSCTTSGGTGSCSVTLNSAVAGITTVKATTDVSIGGVSVHRETDGNGLNSAPMVKTYVDAKISITPNGVNEVNHAHTFTGHVDVNPGTGFVNAAAGTTINFNVASGPGTLTPTSCLTLGATGSCTVSLNSSVAGVTQVGASTTVTVGGLPVSRTTNGANGNSGLATKTWVDANIQVGIDGTNEIGHAHTVTGHVNVNDGTGFASAPQNTLITFSIASGPGTLTPLTCLTVTNTGTCSVSLNSSVTGVTKVNASTTVNILGVSVSRTTDALGANSGPLTKTWVNAKISIGNDGTNAVGSPHTVTGHVFVDPGTGFIDAPDGTVINFSIQSGPGNLSASSCTVNNGLGTCSVTLNSSVTGVTIVNATSTPIVGGVPVSRSTNGANGNSGPLTKTWVNAGISVGNDGTNEVGDPHTVTGHVTVDPGSGPIDAPNGTVISFAIATGPGTLTPTSCTVTNGFGSCSVTLNSSVAGVTKVNASSSLSVGGVSFTLTTDGLGGNSGPLTKTWVDARIHVGNDGTNEVGDPHTVTGHVEINDGSGWVDAPNGTEIDFSIASGPGDLSAPSCTTSGGGGECSVTLTSSVAGVTKVDASTDVTVGGLSLHRTTDNLAGNGGPLTKTWVDANIAIAKNGTNEVGDKHTFTGHVNVNDGSGFANAPAGTEIDFTIVSGPGSLSAASCLTVGATGECSVDLNSDDPGVTTVSAATDVTVGGLLLHRETDGTHGSSDPAVKTYVDARISITPGEATNEVNHKHTFTGHVEVNDGSGWADAADGTEIDFAITAGPGSLSAPSCLTSGGGGTCTVDLNSTVPGVTTLSASSDPVVGGLTLHRTTDGLAGNSDPATKTWVDARIHVGNDGVNEVGSPHTVTGHVEVNDGTNGWVDAPDGTEIDFAIVSGPGNLSASSCLTSGGGGTCSVTLNSSTTGISDVSASTTVTVGGESISRTTDGLAGNGEDLSKTWVDGWITVTPLKATNGIGEAHTITAHVTQDNGGTVSTAPDGTKVEFSLSNNTAGASFVGGVDECTTTGGDCSVQINTTSAGGVDIHASTTFSVGGVSITRATDGTGNNSVDAHKDYLAGTLTWEKRALTTGGALLGGAEFQVCRTFTWNSATASLVDNNPDVCQTVADDTDGVAGPGPDMDPAAGKFKLEDLVLGRYTVKETVAPAGYVLDTHTYTADVVPASVDGVIGTPFVDTKAGQCSRTLGFWMNHPQYWDQAGDLTATNAGFITTTVFPWTKPGSAMAGAKYLQILQTAPGGDLSIQVARQYIAAVLNVAAFGGDPNINGLILQTQDYFDGLAGQPGSTADNGDPDSVDQFTQPVGSNPNGQAKNAASALIAALDAYNSGNEVFCNPGQNPPS